MKKSIIIAAIAAVFTVNANAQSASDYDLYEIKKSISYKVYYVNFRKS